MDALKGNFIWKFIVWLSAPAWVASHLSLAATPVERQTVLETALKSVLYCKPQVAPTLRDSLNQLDPEGAFLYQLFWLKNSGERSQFGVTREKVQKGVIWNWEGEFWRDEWEDLKGRSVPCGTQESPKMAEISSFLKEWGERFQSFGIEGRRAWTHARLEQWEFTHEVPSEAERNKVQLLLKADPDLQNLKDRTFRLLGDAYFELGKWDQAWKDGWVQVSQESAPMDYRKAMALLEGGRPEHLEEGLSLALRYLDLSKADEDSFFSSRIQWQVCKVLEKVDPTSAVQFFSRTIELKQLPGRVLKWTEPCLVLMAPRTRAWKGVRIWERLLEVRGLESKGLQVYGQIALSHLIWGGSKKIEGTRKRLKRQYAKLGRDDFEFKWKGLVRKAQTLTRTLNGSDGVSSSQGQESLKRDVGRASHEVHLDLGKLKLPPVERVQNPSDFAIYFQSYVQKKMGH